MVNEAYGDFPWRVSDRRIDDWFLSSADWPRLRESDVVKPYFRDKNRVDAHQPGMILRRLGDTALVRWQDLSEDRLPLKYLIKTEPPGKGPFQK